jgi:hypothetical protein
MSFFEPVSLFQRCARVTAQCRLRAAWTRPHWGTEDHG